MKNVRDSETVLHLHDVSVALQKSEVSEYTDRY